MSGQGEENWSEPKGFNQNLKEKSYLNVKVKKVKWHLPQDSNKCHLDQRTTILSGNNPAKKWRHRPYIFNHIIAKDEVIALNAFSWYTDL